VKRLIIVYALILLTGGIERIVMLANHHPCGTILDLVR
jgi:hypothetical protein